MPTPERDEDVREIAKEAGRAAGREALREMMITMGVDTSNPKAIIEMQKDFQSLRSWRRSIDTVRRQTLISAVGVIVVGALGIIYMHFFRR